MLFNELSPGQERMKSTLMFLLRLMAFSLPLYGIIFFADLTVLQGAVAGNSYWVMEGMGLSPSINGAEMQVDDFHFIISKDSTGWKSMLFLGALILSVPAVSWKRRGLGLVIGIPLVYIGNLGRVVGIVMVEQAWGVEAAMIVHDWLWRFGLIALVLCIWGIWFWRVRRGR
ncbi:MAG: exosortase/archaeosortase family protein [Candidatus Aenigmarchaeota archaeon]|nr:exosortase/archaeosortase family protein [Candidatus Aenigmarchaeota archaeon]